MILTKRKSLLVGWDRWNIVLGVVFLPKIEVRIVVDQCKACKIVQLFVLPARHRSAELRFLSQKLSVSQFFVENFSIDLIESIFNLIKQRVSLPLLDCKFLARAFRCLLKSLDAVSYLGARQTIRQRLQGLHQYRFRFFCLVGFLIILFLSRNVFIFRQNIRTLTKQEYRNILDFITQQRQILHAAQTV